MRLPGRVFFWFLAVCGALALGLLGLWLGFVAYIQWWDAPNVRGFLKVSDRFEQAVLTQLASSNADLDCEAVVQMLAVGTRLQLPGAWRALESAHQDGRCGQWPGRREYLAGESGWVFRARMAESEIKQRHGWEGSFQRGRHLALALLSPSSDWRRHHRLLLSADPACEPHGGWVELLTFRQNLAAASLKFEDFSYFYIDGYMRAAETACVEQVHARWASEFLRLEDRPVQAYGSPRVLAAERLQYLPHPEAAWLTAFHPALDQALWLRGQSIGYSSGYSSSLSPWEHDLSVLGDLRRPVALGHEEAARTLLSLEPFDWTRFAENQELIGSLGAGGYATPFWMAVHAQRFSLPYVEQRRAAYEAEIGEACTALARRIGAMLPALYAQLPEDRPEVRDLILSSLACQPEGLREAAAYPGGGYWPPEIDRVAPDFTPRMIPEGWVWREGNTQ
jgi:hypothetical protein